MFMRYFGETDDTPTKIGTVIGDIISGFIYVGVLGLLYAGWSVINSVLAK
jgi:crotonobetainyl-CoA:carnitine CoA-transferase CaiB-like acyl-CoA transferase